MGGRPLRSRAISSPIQVGQFWPSGKMDLSYPATVAVGASASARKREFEPAE